MAFSRTQGSSATARLTRSLARFFAWWRSELASLFPARLRQWWSESERVVVLVFDDAGGARFEGLRKGRRDLLMSIKMADYEDSGKGANLRNSLAQHMSGSYSLSLCLARGTTLRRSVQLPLAAEENLRQTLAYEIDRFTPFKADQVYFDYRVLDRNAAQGYLTVEIILAKRSIVDQALKHASRIGLTPNSVAPCDDHLPAISPFNLMPGDHSRRGGSLSVWFRLILAVFTLSMAVILLAIPLLQKRTAAISLLSPLSEAKQAVAETDKLRERLDKMVALHNQLPDRKWQDYSLLAALAEVTKLLPDDTFVTALDYDGKSVQIQGESASAAGLVEVLDASQLFKDVSFKASVAKIRGTAYERFHISATLDSGALPVRPVRDPASPSPNHPQEEGQ